MSKGKRDTYTSEFKQKVASEAMSNNKTLAQLASEYRVPPSQIAKWKERLKGSAGAVFSSPSRRQRQENVTEADLMEKVGRLTVEGDWLKKILAAGDKPGRIELLKGETGEKRLPFGRKCELLGISPSTAYSRREPVANPRDEEDMELARKIEGIYEKCPFYGSRRIVHEISRDERPVNRKHVWRLMRKTGISGLSPGPATSRPHPAA